MHKIGILGGTFDPIHFGHLRIGIECTACLSLSELRLILCAEPPHRNKPFATSSQRFNMLTLALSGASNIVADDREVLRKGFSYTFDTLESLKKDFPDSSLYLIIGSDSFQNLNQWHRWQEIFNLANIIIAQRPDCKDDKNSDVGKILTHRFCSPDEIDLSKSGKISCLPVSQLDISSSKLRRFFKDNKPVQYLLPDAVISYIKDEKLYQT